MRARASDPATGDPSTASSMPHRNASENASFPPERCNDSQPATTPGTVTLAGPVTGTAARPPRSSSATRRGAAPLALIEVTSPPGWRSSAIMSPPTEHMCG